MYGIPKDVITWYKLGMKELSPKYWHIFYDFEIVSKEYKAIAEKYKAAKPKKNVLISNKDILDAFRK